MEIKKKKSNIPTELYINLAIRYSPIWVPCAVVVLFLSFLLVPFISKASKLSRQIEEKSNFITMAERSNKDIAQMTKDLVILRKKVVEFENRLPQRMKTTLI